MIAHTAQANAGLGTPIITSQMVTATTTSTPDQDAEIDPVQHRNS